MSKLNKQLHRTLRDEALIDPTDNVTEIELYHLRVLDLLEVDFCESMGVFINKMYDADVCHVEAAGRLNGESWTKVL